LVKKYDVSEADPASLNRQNYKTYYVVSNTGFNLYPRYRDKDYLHLLDPKESSRSRVNS
jgi:hypothetical protein